jgi:transcriptional regulator with XRE-family HTH domain
VKVRLKSPQELRSLMIQKGFNQTSFAKHIDLSYEYLSKIVNEQLFPSGKAARKIYEGLDLEFDDIFFIENGDSSHHDKER